MTTRPAQNSRTASVLAVVLLSRTASALDPTLAIEQYAHETWTTQDGLPEGSVLSLIQTSDGYLWAGTQCCLVRYDGHHFVTFEEGRLGLPQYSFVRDLIETPDGALWAGLVGGLARRFHGTFDVYAEKDGLTHPFVYALAPGPGGSLWVGTGGAGVWRFGPRSMPPSSSPFSPHPAYVSKSDLPGKINDLQMGPAGTLWAATDEGVLALGSSNRAFTTADGLPSPVANVLLLDGQGGLWVGTRHGLAHAAISGELRFSVQEGVAEDDVTSLLEDRNHQLWIGTRDGGLHRLRSGHINRSEPEGPDAAGGVYALTEDRAGSIWVGTSRGIERFRTGAFTTLGRAEGFRSDRIFNVLPRRAGGVWVLDGSGSVSVYENGRRQPIAPPGTIEGEGMLGLLEAPNGDLWVGGATLRRFREDGWKSYSHAGGDFTVLAPDGSGMLVAQTSTDGTSTLSRFSDDHFEPLSIGAELRHVQRIFRDGKGRLWISTGGLGLVRVAGDQIRVFRVGDGLPHNVVYGISEDDRGDVWVATRAGLARIRDDSLVSLATVPGAPHRSPVHVEVDGLGFLWVTADDGIYRLSIASLNAVADGRIGHVIAQRFTTRDGLGSVEVSWRCSAQAKTPDGRIYYATARGLSVVDPRSVGPSPAPPLSVAIDDLYAGGRRVDTSANVAIREGRERIELRFSAPALVDADAVDVRYRLDGYDSDWTEARSDRAASYTSIPPGKYVFRVAAMPSERTAGGERHL